MDYNLLLRRKARAILKALALSGGEANFSQVARETGIPRSTLEYNLRLLEKGGLVVRVGRGFIKLAVKTPLFYLFDAPCEYAYFGLLGERGERKEAETDTAVKLLEMEGVKPSKVVVVTTYRAASDWEKASVRAEWVLLSDQEITNVDSVEERVRGKLEELMRDYKVVMDCTAATKPATIAFYKMATALKVPLVYVYEKQKKLIWIISPDDLKRDLLQEKG
ncbi:MAG: winged helix-turn-helix domain-containing protein [Candidatus Jordarchaeales archaeon]